MFYAGRYSREIDFVEFLARGAAAFFVSTLARGEKYSVCSQSTMCVCERERDSLFPFSVVCAQCAVRCNVAAVAGAFFSFDFSIWFFFSSYFFRRLGRFSFFFFFFFRARAEASAFLSRIYFNYDDFEVFLSTYIYLWNLSTVGLYNLRNLCENKSMYTTDLEGHVTLLVFITRGI